MNKPVAWGMKDKDGNIYDVICPEEHDRAEGDYTIPLYTHPSKAITDEEKWEIFTHLKRSPDLRTDMIRFADSILRKAHEK